MATRPDILVVLTDQQRPDSIGVYGQSLPTTPVLDSLASGGAVFDTALTVQPVCGPARASLQTGRYPTQVGCWRNGLALCPNQPTMASLLADAGYLTGYVGKWHLASDRGPNLPADRPKAPFAKRPVPPERRGGYRDVWVAADALELTSGPYQGQIYDEDGRTVALRGYRVDAITEIAADRLAGLCQQDEPFLMVVSFLEPHHQNNRFRTVAPRGAARRFADFDTPGDLTGTIGDWRWNLAATLACANAIDNGLGQLLDVLDRYGRFDNCIVIFTSDHGSHFRTRNLEYKRSPHDASIRIPLVVHGAGFTPGTRSTQLVTHLDILPSLLAAAGQPTEGLPGRRLQDALDGTAGPGHVLIQISESQIGRALRTATHTFAAAAPGWNPLSGHLHSRADRYRATHLYDLSADPHQRHNLVNDSAHESVRDALAAQLADAIEATERTAAAVTR